MNSSMRLSAKEVMDEFRIIAGEVSDTVVRILTKITKDVSVLKCLTDIKRYDQATYEHCLRVFRYATLIAKVYETSEKDMCILGKAALLHDVGKICIPVNILRKPGKLTSRERSIVECHVLEGCLRLEREHVNKAVIRIVSQHHERTNGLGYPLGMALNKLEDMSQYLAIADVYDAVTHKRCYHEPISSVEAQILILSTDGLDGLVLCSLALGLDKEKKC